MGKLTLVLNPANDRGFLRGEFVDLYGAKCSIQESSLASKSAIWLGVNEPEIKVMVPGEGWKDVPIPEGALRSGRMHLSQQQVYDLLPILQHFAETGKLPGEVVKAPGETLPQFVKLLGVPRGTVERLIYQYKERVGEPERIGSVRVWPAGTVDVLKAILAEEERAKSAERM